uniref:Microtubule associated protein 1A n=1 Tax=Myotis myotis TaxID=51298 RepID=A0A7J8ANM9_MYOMY|nr:microtubule associated protein 1A [Myotis myotis]
METEAGPWRPRGVTMETSPGLRLPSPSSLLSPNPAEPLCEARATVAAARWDLRKHSLLIVIGDIGTESQLRAVRAHLEQGILSWNIDLSSFDLNQQLRLFITRHLAHFSSEVKGQRTLCHQSEILETVILVNPSADSISSEPVSSQTTDPEWAKFRARGGPHPTEWYLLLSKLCPGSSQPGDCPIAQQ